MWLVAITWLAGAICVLVMKKLQPEGYIIYAVYVLAVLVLLTTFVALYIYRW